MAGQIIKRGERNFIVRIYLGRDATGKRDYLNQTVRGNKKDAQAVLNKLLRDKDMGALVEPARISLDEYLDHWLETSVKPRVREGTHQEYTATLRRNVRPTLGAKKLGSIKPVDIQGLYTEMQKRGLKDSVRYTHTVLKDALKQAVKWQMLAQNPADFVDLPKMSRSKVQALTQEESQRFLEVAKPTKWGCFFSLLLSTGLRPSEALGLYWTDLDMARGTLTVRRGLRRLKGKWVLEDPKTPSARRTLPIPVSLVSLLSAHMETQRELGFNGPLIFTSPTGAPKHEDGIVKDYFKPLLMKAGLPKTVRLYDLRHTHATLLLLAGVHPKVVSERLGHSNITITLNTYSHVLPNMQQAATDKLEAMLFSEPEAPTKVPLAN